MHLTQHTVENAKPQVKPYEIHDKGRNHVRGLLLRVQPSGAKTYYVQIARGKREKVGPSALTLEAAREKAKAIIGKAAAGHDYQAERRRKRAMKSETLRAYLDGGFGTYAQANIATADEMLRSVRKAFAHVLDKPMQDINEMDMARWRKERAHLSVKSLKCELSYLKAVLNRAVDEKLIAGHQLIVYKVRATLVDKQAAPKLRFLDKNEENRLRATLADRDERMAKERNSANQWRRERGQPELPAINGYADHITPLVLLALNTGLRRGDLFDLTWDKLDLKNRQMTLVISKTSHVRRKAGKPVLPVTLPLSSEAAKVLTRWRKQVKTVRVFESPHGGRLNNIDTAWGALLKEAGITGFRFHDLRHTFASRLVVAGVDLNTIRELMTHSDIKMTLIYAHLSPDHKAAALDRAFSELR